MHQAAAAAVMLCVSVAIVCAAAQHFGQPKLCRNSQWALRVVGQVGVGRALPKGSITHSILLTE